MPANTVASDAAAAAADLAAFDSIIGVDTGRRGTAQRVFRKAAIRSATRGLEHYAAAAFLECPRAALYADLVRTGLSCAHAAALVTHAAPWLGSPVVQHADFLRAVVSYREQLQAAAQAAAFEALGPVEASASIGSAGGGVSVNGASVQLPAGCLKADVEMEVKVMNVTHSSGDRAPLVARTAELNQLGAEPTGALLELQPHGATFEKPVRLEIQVPEGDENKGLVLLHRDEGAADGWEVLSNPCRAIGPGLVAVEVEAFCFMVLSFPFSGMESLRRIELSSGAPTWRTVRPGIALDVTCENKECKAVNKQVLCNLGRSRFDLQLDWSKVCCPQCAEPCPRRPSDTVVFFDCGWKYEGLMVDGESKAAEGRADAKAAYAMERGAEKGTIDVMWKSLVISASE